MNRERKEWVTRYKFVEECGCGLNIEAETMEAAAQAVSTDYVTHGHNRGKPTVSGVLYERPGLQLGTINLDFLDERATFVAGGPPIPCGDGWHFVCAGCGKKCHTDSPPIEHPELFDDSLPPDLAYVCDTCFSQGKEASCHT